MPGDSDYPNLLTLTVLAAEDVTHYYPISFRGREALSEPFEYHLDIRAREIPASIGKLIGQLVEWVLTWADDEPRTFAGRIYEARLVTGSDHIPIIRLVVRPAYWATSYARGIHFVQDKSSVDIFKAVTASVPGLVTDVQPSAPTRAYAVRYDETELEFLDRMLAQDGIFYYFVYDKSAGAYRHKMRLANAVSGYADVPKDVALAYVPGSGDINDILGVDVAASAGKRRLHAFEVNKLDTPFRTNATVGKSWSSVYDHSYDEIAGNSLESGQVTARGKSHTAAVEQGADFITGSSVESSFFAGGRVKLDWSDVGAPTKVVLTSVEHIAVDPTHQGGVASYSNSWTAIDSQVAFSPPVPRNRRRAYGPVLGVVKDDKGADGQVVVDNQSRIPVTISQAMESDPDKPFDPFVWLPVAQQWASSTHGAQFFPRIGSRVMIDFFYGDPDLPFVNGTFYTPSAPYPFDPASNATQTGWRSKTDKNGSIKQEFMFEDKPGSEEIYMYTGRNYRRQIDNDELGTIKHDRTIEVQNDHSETVKHDQTVRIENDQTITVIHDRKVTVDNDHTETIGHDQTLEVDNNRQRTVKGTEQISVTKTRDISVTDKNTLESEKAIEFKVGASSILIDMKGITIKAPIISIEGTGSTEVKTAGSSVATSPASVKVFAPIVTLN